MRLKEWLDLLDVSSRRTLGALLDAEFNPVTLAQAAEARGDDGRLVDENVLAARFGGNEAKTFLVIEPLDGAACLFVTHCWKTPFPM